MTDKFNDDPQRSVPAQLGYLTKAVEDQCRHIQKFTKESKEKDAKFEKRLIKIENEISMYKTVIKTIKAIVMTVLFICAFKFGNISGLWK